MRARVRYQQIDSAERGGGFLAEALNIAIPPDVRHDTTRLYALLARFLNNSVKVFRIAGADTYRAAFTS